MTDVVDVNSMKLMHTCAVLFKAKSISQESDMYIQNTHLFIVKAYEPNASASKRLWLHAAQV